MAGEDSDDALIIGDFIFWSSGAEAQGSVILPDCIRGGDIHAYQEAEVWKFAVDTISDIDFPGHPPELSLGACFCQTEDPW